MIPKNKKIKKESKLQTIFFALIIVFFLFGAIGFLVVSNFRINQKRGELIDKIDSLKKEIQVLEEKNQQLQSGINQAETESYWEGRAREQGYKKPGEEAVVVLPPQAENPTSTEKEKGWWQTLLGKIGL